MKNYYKILGVKQDATDAEIKKAGLALVKKYHPDHTGNDPETEALAKDILEAYTSLKNPMKRAAHDRALLMETIDIPWRRTHRNPGSSYTRAHKPDSAPRKETAEEKISKTLREAANKFSATPQGEKPYTLRDAFNLSAGKIWSSFVESHKNNLKNIKTDKGFVNSFGHFYGCVCLIWAVCSMPSNGVGEFVLKAVGAYGAGLAASKSAKLSQYVMAAPGVVAGVTANVIGRIVAPHIVGKQNVRNQQHLAGGLTAAFLIASSLTTAVLAANEGYNLAKQVVSHDLMGYAMEDNSVIHAKVAPWIRAHPELFDPRVSP